MSRSKRTSAWLTLVSGVVLAATLALPTHAQTSATVYEGARLITGGGGTIENSAFTIENGRFTSVGRRGELQAPAGAVRIDLAGKTVMPALVDAHVHMGYRKGLDFGQNNYTRENLTDILER